MDVTLHRIHNSPEQSPRDPIFPELPGYICINGTEELGTFNFSLPAFGAELYFRGGSLYVANCSKFRFAYFLYDAYRRDTNITGLDTLNDDMTYVLPILRPLEVDWRVDLDLLYTLTEFTFGYDLELRDLSVNPPPLVFNLSAEAILTELIVKKAFLDFHTTVRVLQPPLSVLELNLDFGMDNLTLLGTLIGNPWFRHV